MTSLRETAAAALAAGLHPIPIRADGSKAPALSRWRDFQERAPTVAEVNHHFREPDRGLGLVLPAGFECLDFDAHEAWEAYEQVAEASGLEDLLARVAGGYLERTPRGYHVLYRCDAAEGNQKLAKRGAKAIIETRGKGGYIVAAPSCGAVHETGLPYVLERGGLDTILTITPDEREDLLALARSLGDREPPREERRASKVPTGELRPGDDFVARSTWEELLEPHGWVKLRTDSTGEAYWRRPGKNVGQSATTNYQGSGLLYVFSTSTVFEAGRGYNRFSAYSELEHGGDFRAAARELARKGYGEQRLTEPEPGVDLSGILDPAPPAPSPAPGDLPKHLFEVPGLVGDLYRYILRTSPRPMPILALGSALAAAGVLFGRKVRDEDDFRTNLYVLGVAKSGWGKKQTRAAVSDAFHAAGLLDLITAGKVKSDAALELLMAAKPRQLLMIDEVAQMYEGFGDKNRGHERGIADVFLEAYSESNGRYQTRHVVNRDSEVIEQPCLSFYGMTVPGRLWEAMTPDQVGSGLLGRMLVFEWARPRPKLQRVRYADKQVPEKLAERLRGWADPVVEGNLAGVLSKDLQPTLAEVSLSTGAREVFDEYVQRVDQRIDDLDKAGEPHGIWTRAYETARKLALIVACGEVPAQEVGQHAVSAAVAKWAVELAENRIWAFIGKVDGFVAANATEAAKKKIVRVVEALGGCATKSQITRKMQDLRRFERDEALSDLVEAGALLRAERPTSGRSITTYSLPSSKKASTSAPAHEERSDANPPCL